MSKAAINRIDKQMENLDPECLRAQVLASLRQFRSSWVELGRLLTDVAYGGDYKEWGYVDFEVYCARELGLKKPTVQKLMVSYNYMRSNEPDRLKAYDEAGAGGMPPEIPDYQTVELLHRLRENDSLDEETKNDFHRRAFTGEDDGDLRKELRENLRPDAGEIDQANTNRKKELTDILRTARALRRKLAHTRAIPGGLKDRLEQILVELEALD